MRIGVFGGTFDPPHLGHLLVATDAYEALGLDRLLFVPAATQPLKAGVIGVAPEARLEMTRRLVGEDPRFGVDPIEIERGGLSFMVDTLAALAAKWAGAELFLLVGADVLATFDRWREPARVRELATMVVLTRADDPGAAGLASGDPRAADVAHVGGIDQALPGGPPRRLATRRVDVSSTEIRSRIRAGLSIRGFVPESVADFIESAGLYR
jgi:nicotinate-nucleotide adenylyltransferase